MSDLNISNFKKNLGLQLKEEGEDTPLIEGEESDLESESVEPDVLESGEVDTLTSTNKPEEGLLEEDKSKTGDQPVEKNSEGVEPDVSLNNDKPVEDSVPTGLNNKAVEEYLSEMLGKKFSIEDLSKEPEVNPLESDPLLKELYEFRSKTGRSVEDWLQFQKNYDEVSDLDVVREFLQHKYPTFTEEELRQELSDYAESEYDLDDEASRKRLRLKKLAIEGRETLKGFKSKLGDASLAKLPEEVQNKLKFAEEVEQSMQTTQKAQEDYTKAVRDAVESTEVLKLDLGDSELDFLITPEYRKEVSRTIEEMPHWRNSDGSWNHKAVVEDGIKIKYHGEMLKLAYEQGLNAGKDSIIDETKNTNFDDKGSINQPNAPKRGSKIDDFDKIIGKQTIGLRFGKK